VDAGKAEAGGMKAPGSKTPVSSEQRKG